MKRFHMFGTNGPFRKYGLMVASVGLLVALAVPPSQANDLSAAQAQLQEAKVQTSSIQAQLIALKGQASSLKDQLATVTADIDQINQKMNGLQAQIDHKSREIGASEQKIAQTEQQIKARDALLSQRLRVMYENGSATYLDVIFSSTSFSDFLDRLNVLSLIAQQDHQLLLAAKLDRERLQTEMNALLTQQKERKDSLQLLSIEKQTQQQNEQVRQILLNHVDQTINSKQKELDDEQSAMNRLANEVQSLRAEADRKLQSVGSSQTLHGTGHWLWPVPSSHVVSSGYGWRTLYGKPNFHGGIDIAAPVGTPIVAAADGVVLFAGPASGYGHWVVIEHAGGMMSIYGHMYGYEIYVQPGEVVHAGQKIAGVGSDGESTGAHCHFGVATGITDGRMDVVNPWSYLS